MQSPERAIFLDRDGVLNRNVFYADTGQWESPRSPEAAELAMEAPAALRALHAAGYLLIVVSNQPNAAKGKCSRETLDQVHARLVALFIEQGVTLHAHFLCFHHPEHTGPCACRKPSPYFLFEAAAQFGIDLKQSWMIGDRATDVACGRAAGSRTVWIDNGEGNSPPPAAAPADLAVSGIREAANQILSGKHS